MEELIARVFAARTLAHTVHLQTYSYAEHMALGDFYDAVIDVADTLAEVWQGGVGRPLGMLPAVTVGEGATPIAATLRAEAEWIEANRNAVSGGMTCVENQIDELLAVYYQALDRLRRV